MARFWNWLLVRNLRFIPTFRYEIRDIPSTARRGLFNTSLGDFVDADRAAALRFAEDIAEGLLSHIEIDLQNRLADDREALDRIEPAKKALSQQ